MARPRQRRPEPLVALYVDLVELLIRKVRRGTSSRRQAAASDCLAHAVSWVNRCLSLLLSKGGSADCWAISDAPGPSRLSGRSGRLICIRERIVVALDVDDDLVLVAGERGRVGHERPVVSKRVLGDTPLLCRPRRPHAILRAGPIASAANRRCCGANRDEETRRSRGDWLSEASAGTSVQPKNTRRLNDPVSISKRRGRIRDDRARCGGPTRRAGRRRRVR